MKRKFIYTLLLVASAVMLFASCNDEITEESTESPDIITEQTPDSNYEENTYTEETTKAEETTKEQESLTGTVIGYTSKGYVITEKDGITYVDGVLVANKTYSLPESYNPGDLLDECEDAFNAMKKDAAKEGLNIWNASGFRSYDLQQSLYTRYSNRDGKEAADRYSARPGHSEHQTGLAIDLNEISSAFADTKEGIWVAENCHKYGFILRYMKDKEAQTGYMYEPWHIRYVGVDVATKIYNSGLCLEEFYGITSQYAANEAAVETTIAPSVEQTYAEEITSEAATAFSDEATTTIILVD